MGLAAPAAPAAGKVPGPRRPALARASRVRVPGQDVRNLDIDMR